MTFFFLLLYGLLGSAYLLLFLAYMYGWRRTKPFRVPAAYTASTSITVVIAARNEAANIEACIRSLLAQDYPAGLFRIIVADDHSTDNTADIIRGIHAPNLQLVLMQELPEQPGISFKKKALAAAIALSGDELIVTTDADCTAGPGWLRHIAAYYWQTGAQLIVAPVHYRPLASLAGIFQSLDFMSMQGITAATVTLDLGIMCNGANLAFTRSAYQAVNGYEGVLHIVSGDDYLLMMKIKQQFPNEVRYLKSSAAIIETLPQPDWRSFLRQRVRWASKTGKYEDRKMTWILLLVYLFNLSLLLSGIMSIFNPVLLALTGLFLAAKTLLELCYLLPVTRFYRNTPQLLWFPFLQPLHIIYIVVAGFLSRSGSYAWKDRQIKQH